jgi:hypothetical protein
VAAIGKGRNRAEKRYRRESGVRPRRLDESAAPSPVGTEAAASKAAVPGRWRSRVGSSVVQEAAIIEWLLDRISERLSGMADTTLRRGLSLVVERYERVLVEWSVQAPTPEQRIMLLENVNALHDRVVCQSTKEPPAK